jgi:hypothetical protein
MALFAHGLFDARKNGSFGAGFYYYGISDLLKQDIAQLSGGEAATQNEKGTEVFYDFAITPAVRLIPSYQLEPAHRRGDEKPTRHRYFLARFAVIW